MKIAIASGKGGTGKTTLATNLAYVAAQRGFRTAYVDCDVEEPNGHLFLHPMIEDQRVVNESVPQVDRELCGLCGQCGDICRFSAILAIGNSVLVYPQLCHGCGGCALVCPTHAITEVPHPLGEMQSGGAGPLRFVQGKLNIGEARSAPVIRAVRAAIPSVELAIFDAPPGTSCPTIASVRDTDHVLLVTEPTPFGLNDLRLAVEMVRMLKLPLAVVVNRAGAGDDRVTRYCHVEGIEIWAEIPDDRRIGEAYARGRLICEALPEYQSVFSGLLDRALQRTPGVKSQEAAA